jgi:hypothetical protein
MVAAVAGEEVDQEVLAAVAGLAPGRFADAVAEAVAAEEAHRAGLAITGHAHGAQGIADAVAAGFDGIEHGLSLTADGVRQDPAVVDQLAARRVVVSVTAAQNQPLGQPPPGMEPGSDLARRFEELAEQLKAGVAGVLRLRAAGVPLTISSDAGIGPHKPHDVLPWAPGLASMVGLGGLAADRERPRPAALAQHPDDPLVQVDIVQGHADAFGPAHPGVDQQQDDGGVAAAGEVATLTGPEQPSQMLGPNHADRLLGQLGRSHAVHGAGRQVTLGHGPLEEGVQPAVAVVGGRRLPAGELVGDERLDVLAAKLAGEDRMAVGLAVGGEQPDGVGVGLDGPGALVLGFQSASEASVEG